MKKKTLSILSLCIALFAALALVGCGGIASGGGSSTSKSEGKEKAPVAEKTDFIWFKVEMPESVGVSDSAGKNADRVQLTFPENENTTVDRFIPVWEEKMTAEEALADEGRKNSMFQWKVGDPVEYNGRTWLTGTCEDNRGTHTYLLPTLNREASAFSSRTSISTRKKPRRSSTPSSSPMTWRRQLPRHAKLRFRASSSSNGTPHTPTYARPIKTTGTQPRGGPTTSALPSFAPAHIAT